MKKAHIDNLSATPKKATRPTVPFIEMVKEPVAVQVLIAGLIVFVVGLWLESAVAVVVGSIVMIAFPTVARVMMILKERHMTNFD